MSKRKEDFWKNHEQFKPENWRKIPLKSKTYAYMDFTYEPDLHWEDEVIDPIFKQATYDGESVVCLVAPTASGKTSAIFRALTTQYGIYFCCDSSKGLFADFNTSTRDYLMDAFWGNMKNLSAEEIIAFGGNILIWFSFLVYFL